MCVWYSIPNGILFQMSPLPTLTLCQSTKAITRCIVTHGTDLSRYSESVAALSFPSHAVERYSQSPGMVLGLWPCPLACGPAPQLPMYGDTYCTEMLYNTVVMCAEHLHFSALLFQGYEDGQQCLSLTCYLC